jgi:hypothetical protein
MSEEFWLLSRDVARDQQFGRFAGPTSGPRGMSADHCRTCERFAQFLLEHVADPGTQMLTNANWP